MIARCLLFFVAALVPPVLRAEAPRIQMIEPGRPLPALAFYRNQPAVWQLTGFFNGSTNAPVTADLNLVANGLVAPYQKSISVFPGGTPNRKTGILSEISLTLPKVEKATRFVLIFRQADQAISTQSIEQFPEIPGGFLRSLLVSSPIGRELAVFGAGETIRKFFDTAKVPYRDLGSSPPESAREWLDSLNEEAGSLSGLVLTTDGRAPVTLLFSPDSRKPPGVYVRNQTALITLPIASSLGTDPRSERLLVEILEMLLTQP